MRLNLDAQRSSRLTRKIPSVTMHLRLEADAEANAEKIILPITDEDLSL